MLWLLFILPVVSSTVFPYPLKDFRTDCQRSDGNGVCDLQCRNFFPGAEEADCREKDLVSQRRNKSKRTVTKDRYGGIWGVMLERMVCQQQR